MKKMPPALINKAQAAIKIIAKHSAGKATP
jgi:hypothetical protein